VTPEEMHGTITAIFEALNETGWDGPAVTQYYEPDTVIHTFPEWPGADVYRGHDGLIAVLEEWTENFDDMHLELVRLVEVEDRAVVLGWMSGSSKAQGVPTRIQLGSLVEFGDSRLRESWFYLSWDEALKKAGVEDESTA
jgi:ketosteroid isomerase-like protein